MKQLFFLLFVSCISVSIIAQEKVDERDLAEFKNRLEGFFINELQAKADTDYSNIQLHSAAIWTRSEDGYWLYVEELKASQLAIPYQQHIYHLYRKDDITLVRTIFELSEPLRFAGAYDNPELLRGVTKDSLIKQQGCEVYFHKNVAGDFMGVTPGKECIGLQGAAYTTTHITVYENSFVSWQQGWDEHDKQVAGIIKGGYQFMKQE